jgi:hypothetical protein
MNTPFSFIPHEQPLVDVEECLDLLRHFSHLLSGLDLLWCSVCLCEGLDCMLC